MIPRPRCPSRRASVRCALLLAVSGLVILAAGFAAAIAAGVASAGSLTGMASACLASAREWPAVFLRDGGVTGAASLVALLFFLATVRGVRVFAGQWLATRRLIASLAVQRGAEAASIPALAKEAGLDGRVDPVRDERLFVFTHGFLCPRVVVSSGLAGFLSEAELLSVLFHEKYHLLQRDPFWVALARAIAAALPLRPIRDLVERYDIGKELAADEFAATRMGEAGPLLGALAKLAGPRPTLMPAAAAGLDGAQGMALRLRRLLAYPSLHVSSLEGIPLRVTAGLLGLVVLALSAIWVLARWFGPVTLAAVCATGLICPS